jgi:hypothetical protein
VAASVLLHLNDEIVFGVGADHDSAVFTCEVKGHEVSLWMAWTWCTSLCVATVDEEESDDERDSRVQCEDAEARPRA